jgi:hypothetical protein
MEARGVGMAIDRAGRKEGRSAKSKMKLLMTGPTLQILQKVLPRYSMAWPPGVVDDQASPTGYRKHLSRSGHNVCGTGMS